MKTIILFVGAGSIGLAIGTAYDRAKKAFNKRFPEYEPLVENNHDVSILGLGIACTSMGYFFGSGLPIGANLPTLGVTTGCVLIYHDNLINLWGVLKKLTCRSNKPSVPTLTGCPYDSEEKATKENRPSRSLPGMRLFAASNWVSKWGDKLPAVLDLVFK